MRRNVLLRRLTRVYAGLVGLLVVVFVFSSQSEVSSPGERSGGGILVGPEPPLAWSLIRFSWKAVLVLSVAGLVPALLLAARRRIRWRSALALLAPYVLVLAVATISWPQMTTYEQAFSGIDPGNYAHYLRKPWPYGTPTTHALERQVYAYRHSERFAAKTLLYVGKAHPYDPLAVWRVLTPILTAHYGGFSMQNTFADRLWVVRRAGWTEVFVFRDAAEARRNEPRARACSWHEVLGNVLVKASACTPKGFKPTPGASIAVIRPAAIEIADALEQAAARGQLSGRGVGSRPARR